MSSVLGDNFPVHGFNSDLADQSADILNLDGGLDTGDAEGTFENDEGKEIDNIVIVVNDDHDEIPAETTDDDVELSPGGILDEETITRGMSNLGSSASGCHQVYLNVTIPGFSLTDISLLSEYQHLQKVEIPYNDITDLSPLGKLKYLLFLDASHNKIKKLLDFDPPFNLLEVNMSWNIVQNMCDLSAHRFLKKLILDNNSISSIHGLQNCKRLKHLSLSHNNISNIEGLDGLPIQHLNISNNKIKFLQNLEFLTHLKKVNLSGNCIRSLSGLKSNTMLESLDLEDNEVLDVMEMSHISQAKNLEDLNLLRNPIQELPEYRLSILYRIRKLTILDRHPVKEQEKVAAINMFDPPMEIIAASDHIMHVVYSFLQPSRVRDSTLPNIGTPYPMLVLVGPQGSGKRKLTMNLLQDFGDYFGCGISHTTRRPSLDEVADKDYYFVSLESFEEDIKKGEFIQTCQYNDNWYGLQMASVENVAREGLACVTHMELEGVLSLKRTFFEPRYVLIMPLNSEVHGRRLRDRGIHTEKHIDMFLKRAEMYIKHNQNHPGFFDMMISSDNISEAYKQLHKLVMEYLGINSTEEISSFCHEVMVEGKEVTIESQPAYTSRALSNLMRSSTWSKLSISENVFLPRSSQMDSVLHSRGIVEEESHKRRQSTAKQLVIGYAPTLTEQLLEKLSSFGCNVESSSFLAADYRSMPLSVQKVALITAHLKESLPLARSPNSSVVTLSRYPQATSEATDNQAGLRETKEHKPYSSPTNGLKTELGEIDMLSSTDSSSDTHSVSYISDLDSTPKVHRDEGHKVNTNTNCISILPTEKVNPLDLIDEQSYRKTSKMNLSDASQVSTSRSGSKCAVSRPGSTRHTVLPPIQNIAA